jgi:hypothetical protein
LTFKDQVIGTTSATSTVTLTNSGNATLSITGEAAAGANAFDFAWTDTCTASVAPGANCTISVTFTPSAAGSRTASLAITDNASGSPQTISLAGKGVVALAITTTSLPEATVGSVYSATLVATGGTTPYTWNVGGLTPGLTLNPATGVIAGTPTATATYNLSVGVTDSGNPPQTAGEPLSLVVNSSIVSVDLTPGTATTGTLITSPCTVNFSFPANAVTQPSTVTLTALDSSELPLPLASGTTFVCAFDLEVNPAIAGFGAAVGLGGNVASGLAPPGTTLQLAMYQDPPAASSRAARARLRRTALQPMATGPLWMVVSTLVVGSNESLAQNLATADLPGIMGGGKYVLFVPAPGTTIVSNLGVVLMGDDGAGTGSCADALQVIHLYDAQGNPLATPTINCLSYPGADDLDGTALTPDGSQGVMVDGGNTVRFFSGLQTGTVTASATTVDVSAYGGDGDSIAIMPDGDEAVVSADGTCPSGLTCLLLISGIVSGNPKPATTITVPDNRDGVVISNDGQVLLARGDSGLTVFAITGGTGSYSFTQNGDLPALGSQGTWEDGRDGMAISPADSSRAVVLMPDGSIQLLTGLPSTPTLGTAITPSVSGTMSVSITPDGTTAIVGGSTGVSMISGVDTGSLAEVGTVYSPSYTANGGTVNLSAVSTLAITLDDKYVAACDANNSALLVIPITSSGFGAPVGVLTGVAAPSNDQMVVH